jgi:putative ABC transport system substrate-binding protein
MRRRDFIAGLAGSATLWPIASRAQQPALPAFGSLLTGMPETIRPFLPAVTRGLAEVGYVEGRNFIADRRWVGNDIDRLPAMAADLVRRQVAVIGADTDPATQAAQAATKTIPIVFVTGADPVELGLVASLDHPGGNLTGISIPYTEIVAKQLDLLAKTVPTAKLIAVLTRRAMVSVRKLQVAADVLGVRFLVLNPRNPSDFEDSFATLVRERAGAVLVGPDSLYFQNTDRIVALAARHAVPAMYPIRDHAVAGGLMSYGTDIPDAYRQYGVYIGRILKGGKPADLPVQQITKMELTINLTTARALGLAFPLNLLRRADEVIE